MRRVREAAPYGSAPAVTCSAKPGADVESYQLQFLESQGPVARNEMIKATQILRAGNTAKPSKYASPRNGGSRGRAAWRQGRRSRFCRLRPPPSVFWFLFHVEKELAPHCARRRVSERNRRIAAALGAEMAKPCPTAGVAPPSSNEGTLSSPPHPPQCAHWGTFPPGGRLLRGSAPSSPPNEIKKKGGPTGRPKGQKGKISGTPSPPRPAPPAGGR